jgi:hypothetical protein
MRLWFDAAIGWFTRSRLRTLLAIFLAFVFVGLTKSLIVLFALHDSDRHTRMLVIDSCLSGVLSAAIVAIVLVGVRGRRRRILNYMRQVDALNHHVRNALQTIILHTESTAEQRATLAAIRTSVRRIDQTLRDAFPIVGDRKTDRGKTFHDLTD